jgi:hypothetical protein
MNLWENAMRPLAALFIVIGCLVATQAAAERRVALVVGNSQYQHTTALANPRHDAEDLAHTLEKIGFDVKAGYDLDQGGFARLIDEFAAALDGADVGLFFYAGHGLQINDRNYLVSTGAKLESAFLVASETIELDAVIRLMESKTATNLVFVDACRNNPLADNLKRNLTATHRAAAAVGRDRGLAPVAPAGPDTLIAFAAAPNELAADGDGRNSPFAAALLRHLPEPGLEVSVMLKDVTADVRRDTDNKQRPQQLSGMSRKFYFVNAGPPAAPPAPPPPVAPPPAAASDPVELEFWRSAFAANDCESIRAYQRRYPGGAFAGLAAAAERRLCKPAEIVTAPPQPAPARPPAPEPIPVPGVVPGASTDAGKDPVDMYVTVGQLRMVLAPSPDGEGVAVRQIDPASAHGPLSGIIRLTPLGRLGPSPAESGIHVGDVIINIDGKPTNAPADVVRAVSDSRFRGGDGVEIGVKSQGQGLRLVFVPVIDDTPPDGRASNPWDAQRDRTPHPPPQGPRPGGFGRGRH